jgi:hypothetical protein
MNPQPADTAIGEDVEPHMRDRTVMFELFREEVSVMGLEFRAREDFEPPRVFQVIMWCPRCEAALD